MMKKLLMFTGLLMAVVLTAVPVFASTITGATYIGTVLITNTSSVASNVCVPFTLSTSNLINYNYINSACDNTSIQINGSDVAYMPARTGTSSWMVYSPSVPAGASNAKLYTGGAAMNGKIRYFPGTAGMMIADSGTLEPGDNFTFEQKGFVDTGAGAGKYLIHKQNAFKTYVSAGTVSSAIATVTPNVTIDIVPNAAGTMGGDMPTIFGAATYWEALDDPAGAPDDATTYISSGGSGVNKFAQVNLENPAFLGTWTTKINSVSVYFRITSLNMNLINATPFLYLDGNTTTGALQTDNGAGVYTSYNQTLARPGGGSWTASDIDALEVGITLNDNGNNSFCTQLFIRINYDYAIDSAIVSHALATGEHTIKTTADTVDLKLWIDGVEEASIALGGASVINNVNDWYFVQADCMPYMEYTKITVSGTLQSHIVWENAATFSDLSGHGHTATPTYRTTSNDGDVSAVLTSFEPNNLSQASGSSTGGGTTFITAVPDDSDFPSGSAYDEGNTGGLIINDLVDPALVEADIPVAIFWYPLSFAIAIGVGFLAFGLTKTLLVQAIVSAVVMALFCGGGVLGDGLLPWFTVVIFAIEAVMVLVIQEKFVV